MKKQIITIIACLGLGWGANAQNLKLWYECPASTWVEALPVGNSTMGAMVYGRTAREELQLNEETLWGGKPVQQQ